MYELGSTAGESQELTRHLHPVLVPLHLRKLRVWYVVVPYLRHQHSKTTLTYQTKTNVLSDGSDAINRSPYLISALGPLDGPLVPLRKWDQARGSLLRTMPLPVLEVSGRAQMSQRLLVVQTRYVIRTGRDVT